MEHQYKSYRRGPALAAAAAFGLATTAMLAPAAHANTEADRPEELSSAYTVRADSAEVVGVMGDEAVIETGDETVVEAVIETGDEAVVETDDEAVGDAGAVPGEAEVTEETTIPSNSELGDLCVDGALDGATEEQQTPAATATDPVATDLAVPATGLNEGPADEGLDEEADLPDAEPIDEGTLTSSKCEGAAPGQIDDDPDAGDEGETPLPVGGVDAGIGEAASQNMVLPIAAAGAAAAAIGVGAYTLVRRSRSDA